MVKLLAFVLPLAVDSFAIAALLGASGVTGVQRWRITGLFVVFEAGMPLVGLALGAPLAGAIGSGADYAAAAALIGLGVWMLLSDEQGEEQAAGRLASSSGWAMLGLGVSISLDELAIGFSLGLVGLPTVSVIVAIAVQAFVAVQLGLALGSRVGERLRENAERVAALALIGLGVFVLVARLIRH
jgi:manganese efflux pump family protein